VNEKCIHEQKNIHKYKNKNSEELYLIVTDQWSANLAVNKNTNYKETYKIPNSDVEKDNWN